ncbi:MAG: RidA family protein [Pseudomonadales bacterium]|jgi:enamine deaminase RidA (YjgF/YER057c/UK114 family)
MSFEPVVTASGQFAYDRMHFAQATKSGGFLFLSGVVGTGEKGKLPDNVTEEFNNAWKSIGEIIGEAGAGYGDIVECTTYHVDISSHIGEFSKIRDQYISEPWPAWTAIGISELLIPGASVEIRVTVKLPD